MSATNEMMKEVKESFGQALKDAKFRKRGNNWAREVSETVVLLVNVQSSAWNDANEGRFCVNLGVYHRDLAALHDRLPVVASPLVQNCVVQERLGVLATGEDHWWHFNAQTDLAALGVEVATCWQQYGAPWLDKMISLDNVRDFLLQQRSAFLAAMASFAMGNREEAVVLLDNLIREWPEGRQRIEAWKVQHLGPNVSRRAA